MHNMPPLHTFQEEDKARKEAEFQAIKDLAEMRRNPQKMAEYEKAVPYAVRVRARGLG